MFYDCLGFTLKGTPGLLNTLITMASYFKAYSAFYAVPYVSQTMMIWGGAAAALSTFNLARFLDRNQSVVRAYLMQNRTVVRFELGKG